jgi:hypothetical protein
MRLRLKYELPTVQVIHTYEVRPRKDKRGVDLISDALPFGRLWYAGPNAIGNAIGYAKHRSRSHHAVIRVYADADNVIETHQHTGEFKGGGVHVCAPKTGAKSKTALPPMQDRRYFSNPDGFNFLKPITL